MDIQAYPLPKQLNQQPDAAFFKAPDALYTEEDYSVKPPGYGDIDCILASIREYGPLIAQAKTGPSAYDGAVVMKKAKACGEDVFGWKKGAKIKPDARQRDIVIIGAQKVEAKEEVSKGGGEAAAAAPKAAATGWLYFRLAQDVTGNQECLIRKYQVSTVDPRLFCVPYEFFKVSCLSMLHPPCPYAQWLFVDLEQKAILNEEKARCKEVGQRIFDLYRAQVNASRTEGEKSTHAFDCVVRICDAASVISKERLRSGDIARAWNMIGDDHHRFMS